MVFEDPSQLRWKKVVYVLFAFLFLFEILFVSLIAGSFAEAPSLHYDRFNQEYLQNNSANVRSNNHDSSNVYASSNSYVAANLTTGIGLANSISNSPTDIRISINAKTTMKLPNQKELDKRISNLKQIGMPNDKKALLTAFLTQKDIAYFAWKSLDETGDLETRVKKLDIVFPDWFSNPGSGCDVKESIDWNIFETSLKNKVTVIPSFSNENEIGVAEDFSKIIRDKKKSACLIQQLKWNVRNRSVYGIDIDIQNLAIEDRDFYTVWLLALTEAFHANKLFVAVNVPLGSLAYDYAKIWQITDLTVVRGFDDHTAFGKPGPLASEKWFESFLGITLKQLTSQKKTRVMIAIGTQSADWNLTTKAPPEMKSFEAALKLAAGSHRTIRMDDKSKNQTFTYTGEDGSEHRVWMLDAINAWNENLFLKSKDISPNISGIALGRLGMEDPAVWKFFPTDKMDKSGLDLSALSNLPNPDTSLSIGYKKIFRIMDMPRAGNRTIVFSGSRILSAEYANLPHGFVVQGFWETAPESILGKKTIALTFDGGSDFSQTEQILKILQKYGIHATFFVSKSQIVWYPEIIQKAYMEGNVLGSVVPPHKEAYTSSERELVSSKLKDSTLALSSAVHHQALLLKTPNGSEDETHSLLQSVKDEWYLLVGSDLDFDDINFKEIDLKDLLSREGRDNFVKAVVARLSTISDQKPTSSGTAIQTRSLRSTAQFPTLIVHDSADQRTVSYLDVLIPTLQKQWYSFVTVNEVLGVSRDAVMPENTLSEKFVLFWKNMWTYLFVWGWGILGIIFLATTGICVFRMIFFGIFVFRSGKRKNKFPSRLFQPPVTILVPAYNEEKVIERTILWLLMSDYPKFEIFVIDDGSTDNTAAKVKRMTRKYPNVRLHTKKNDGKSRALNLGFKLAKYDYIITVDADTIVLPDTVSRLMEPFADKNVDAVCGNIGVGNVKNILTAFQEVEYVTGQNFDRRAFDALNCISVVPGATGAWKKDKVIEIGWYSSDTLVEDADLTLALLENGGRIVYAPLAKSITEAPETVAALFKQRFRWSYGTFQCFWKHRGTFGKWPLGNIALPNMIFSQVLFNILSPVGDAALVYAIVTGNHLTSIAIWFAVFFITDAIVAATAYALDHRSLANVWVILIQRFFYRQFMYIVTFKSLIAAIRGTHHGWNKLERKGTVNLVGARRAQ